MSSIRSQLYVARFDTHAADTSVFRGRTSQISDTWLDERFSLSMVRSNQIAYDPSICIVRLSNNPVRPQPCWPLSTPLIWIRSEAFRGVKPPEYSVVFPTFYTLFCYPLSVFLAVRFYSYTLYYSFPTHSGLVISDHYIGIGAISSSVFPYFCV